MGGVPVTFQGVRRIALAIEGVTESTSYGTPVFKLSGKLIARLREDSEMLVVGTTFDERLELIAAEPDTYFITDHYVKYPWVLVHLSCATQTHFEIHYGGPADWHQQRSLARRAARPKAASKRRS